MTSTLLGYLARFASFSAQSEVLCTQGLAYLLQEHEEARTALAGEVEERFADVDTGSAAERWWPGGPRGSNGR
jgi:hypothetical protein